MRISNSLLAVGGWMRFDRRLDAGFRAFLTILPDAWRTAA
jgi:hypothetical protein